MNKDLITSISCLDNEILWCYDEIICALSKVNIKTLQVKCVLSPQYIFREQYYEMRKIIVWKDKVIIIPKEIDKKWIIYDKLSKKVEYYNFCIENFEITDVLLIKDNLFFIPISVNGLIVIFDLVKREVIKKIEFPMNDFLKEGYIWNAKIEGEDICFLIHDSFFYGRLNNDNLSMIKVETLNPLSCADFYMGMGWAIDNSNKYLYSFNKEGRILHTYSIEAGIYFAKIIVKNKYIYLLPFNKNGIWLFDMKGKLIKIIGEEIIDFRLLETFNSPDYWEYMEVDKCIWFLPLKHSLQVVNTNTLMEFKRFFKYSKEFSENLYQEYYKYIKKIRIINSYFHENLINATLIKYIELIITNKDDIEFTEMLLRGKNICDSLTCESKRECM